MLFLRSSVAGVLHEVGCHHVAVGAWTEGDYPVHITVKQIKCDSPEDLEWYTLRHPTPKCMLVPCWSIVGSRIAYSNREVVVAMRQIRRAIGRISNHVHEVSEDSQIALVM